MSKNNVREYLGIMPGQPLTTVQEDKLLCLEDVDTDSLTADELDVVARIGRIRRNIAMLNLILEEK